MKNWKKIAILMLIGTMLLLPNEVSAASVSFKEFSVKNVFIVVSILIIILLLYLGYRMDSNENEKVKEKKSKNTRNSNIKKNLRHVETYESNDNEYEADSSEYEVDNVNPEDISESVEYEDDEETEKSLFEMSEESKPVNDDFGMTRNFDTTELKKEISNEIEEVIDESDDYGEEFDVSIIDKIDEEDNFNPIIPPVVEKAEDIKEDEDYGDEFDVSIIDKIDDDINEIDEMDKVDVNLAENLFIEELKNFKEPESDFEGFSVGVANKELEKVEEKPKRRYTKTKVKPEDATSVLDEDFMKQMEKNLELGKEEPKTTKKTSTRKKKTN